MNVYTVCYKRKQTRLIVGYEKHGKKCLEKNKRIPLCGQNIMYYKRHTKTFYSIPEEQHSLNTRHDFLVGLVGSLVQSDPDALLRTEDELSQGSQFFTTLTCLHIKVTQHSGKNYLLFHHSKALAWRYKQTHKTNLSCTTLLPLIIYQWNLCILGFSSVLEGSRLKAEMINL